MAYPRTKKFVKRVGAFAKRRYAPKGKLQVARIARDVMALKRVINVEKKYVDANWATTVMASLASATGNCITGINQGSTATTRNGNSVKLTSWQLRLRTFARATTGTDVMYRVLVVLDKESNSTRTLLNINEVLNADSNGVCGTTSMYNHDNRHRFLVLEDSMHSLAPFGQNGSTQLVTCSGAISKHLMFTGALGSNYDENQIYFWILPDNDSTTPALYPQWYASTRISFIDN